MNHSHRDERQPPITAPGAPAGNSAGRTCAHFVASLSARVRRRIQIFSCVFAWLVATGCPWDLVQVAAWSRMFAGYSQEMSLAAAAEKTFTGEMCPLCRAVSKAKQAEEENTPKSATAKSETKAVCAAFRAENAVVSPRRRFLGLVPEPACSAGRERTAPPIPPPRAVA